MSEREKKKVTFLFFFILRTLSGSDKFSRFKIKAWFSYASDIPALWAWDTVTAYANINRLIMNLSQALTAGLPAKFKPAVIGDCLR